MQNSFIENNINLNLKRINKVIKGDFLHKSIGKRLILKIKKGTITFVALIQIFSSALGIAKDFDKNISIQINSIITTCKLPNKANLDTKITGHFDIVFEEIKSMMDNKKYLDAYKRARYLKIIAHNLGENEISEFASSLMSDIEHEMRLKIA